MPHRFTIIGPLMVFAVSLTPVVSQEKKTTSVSQPAPRILNRYSTWTQRVLISPDGKTYYCSFRADKEKPAIVRVLNADDGKVKHEMPGGFQIALSPDGKILAINRHREKQVAIWSTEPFRELRQLSTENAALQAEFSADGKTLAVTKGGWSDQEGVVELWDWDKGTLIRSITVGQRLGDIVVPPKSTSFLMRIGDGDLGLWSFDTGVETRRVHEATNRDEQVQRLCKDATGQFVVGSTGPTAFIWKMADWKLVKTLPTKIGGPWPHAIASDGQHVYLAAPASSPIGNFGELMSYHIETGEKQMIYRLLGFGASSMAVSPNSKKLIVGAMTGAIMEFSLK